LLGNSKYLLTKLKTKMKRRESNIEKQNKGVENECDSKSRNKRILTT